MASSQSLSAQQGTRGNALVDWLRLRLAELPTKLLSALIFAGLTRAFGTMGEHPWGSVVVAAAVDGLEVVLGGLAVCYFALFLVGLRELPGRWRAEKARQKAEETRRQAGEKESEERRLQAALDRALAQTNLNNLRYALTETAATQAAVIFDLKNRLEALRERLLEIGIPVPPTVRNLDQATRSTWWQFLGIVKERREDYALLRKFLEEAHSKAQAAH